MAEMSETKATQDNDTCPACGGMRKVDGKHCPDCGDGLIARADEWLEIASAGNEVSSKTLDLAKKLATDLHRKLKRIEQLEQLAGELEEAAQGEWFCPGCDVFLHPSRVTQEAACDTCGEEVWWVFAENPTDHTTGATKGYMVFAKRTDGTAPKPVKAMNDALLWGPAYAAALKNKLDGEGLGVDLEVREVFVHVGGDVTEEVESYLAEAEHRQAMEEGRRTVTREMALDAGDPNLEGTPT